MFNSSYKIATVWGIPIKLHISLILMVLWFAFDFGLLNGTLLTIGLMVSIALHELGHSIVAIKKGCRVRQITLMCIGGAAQMESIPKKPLHEFFMALAGPAVSLGIGLILIFTGNKISLPPVVPLEWNILQILGIINISLVIFNLLPSFPMDGGRVLRAMLTPKFGRLKATFIAARLGQVICILLGIYAFSISHWFGVAIAFFIFISAGNEYRMVQMEEARKRFRFEPNGSNPFRNSSPNNEDDDQVIISPPPYEKGPGSKTYLHIDEDDNPFSKLFK